MVLGYDIGIDGLDLKDHAIDQTLTWISLIKPKSFGSGSIKLEAQSRKMDQIIVWMVEMGLTRVPKLITEVLEVVGDPNQILNGPI